MAGGELVFEMGAQPNSRWGSGVGNVPVSKIDGPPIVPVPVIIAASRTFKDRLGISMRAPGQDRSRSGTTIHYTTDGSDPGPASHRFTAPFFIDRSTTIKALVIAGDGRRSLVATARYQKTPHNWAINLISKYSSQYPGGGDFALIDGIRGTANWSGGAWQGYQGKDFVAVVDLGKIQSVSKLGAGFLQDVGSWIWMPREVEFELSLNGRDFVRVGLIPNDVPEQKYGVIIKDFISTITPQTARYLRVTAHNFGKIPAWHPAQGDDAWIFVDEILVD
jgi:hypothetical protein